MKHIFFLASMLLALSSSTARAMEALEVLDDAKNVTKESKDQLDTLRTALERYETLRQHLEDRSQKCNVTFKEISKKNKTYDDQFKNIKTIGLLLNSGAFFAGLICGILSIYWHRIKETSDPDLSLQEENPDSLTESQP